MLNEIPVAYAITYIFGTVTYAVGNTLLTIWGLVIVLLLS